MTNLLTAALPATATAAPTTDLHLLPAGLTDVDTGPADPLALCAYLTERAETGRATGTLDMACTVIRHVHRTCGITDPVASEAVRQVRRGLRRTDDAAPRRLARPLSVEEIRQIVGSNDRSTPIGTRDTAIILLGFASAMRRAELVAL
jgi:integrase